MQASGQLAAVIESCLPSRTKHRAQLARSVLALMVGTMQIARLAADPQEGVERRLPARRRHPPALRRQPLFSTDELTNEIAAHNRKS